MEFYCISVSHHNAPLEIREKLNCTQEEVYASLAHYLAHNEEYLGPSSEIAILSTCNRFEVYATFRGEKHAFVGKAEEVTRTLLAYISEITGFSEPVLATLYVGYQNLDAVEHLFRVSAGLESQVLGEAQIIGQVAQALEAALQSGTARHTLATLFRSALHAAKRAHTDTTIGKNPASLSSVAASIAEQVLGKMNGQPVVVLGAGEMSALAARAFHARGARNMLIVNRTYANAARLAKQYACQSRPWEELSIALQSADVVVSATGAQHPILTVDMLSAVMDQRQNRPLLLLDIALPRDIEPAIRELPGVTIYDLDDMKLRLNQSIDHRQKEAQQVEMILQEELRDFAHWMKIIPTVGKLHRKAEQIRQQEVERMLQHLPDLDPQVQEHVELLTRSLVKKLFHEPSTKMRTEAQNGQLETYLDTLQFLFGLDEDNNQLPGKQEQRKHD